MLQSSLVRIADRRNPKYCRYASGLLRTRRRVPDAGRRMSSSGMVDHVVHQHFTLPNMARLGVAAQVICVATVSNERGFSDMKLHMTRLRSSLDVEMLEHLILCVSQSRARPSEHPSVRNC
jgi:hypothetical protein